MKLFVVKTKSCYSDNEKIWLSLSFLTYFKHCHFHCCPRYILFCHLWAWPQMTILLISCHFRFFSCHSRENGNPKCWVPQDYKDFSFPGSPGQARRWQGRVGVRVKTGDDNTKNCPPMTVEKQKMTGKGMSRAGSEDDREKCRERIPGTGEVYRHIKSGRRSRPDVMDFAWQHRVRDRYVPGVVRAWTPDRTPPGTIIPLKPNTTMFYLTSAATCIFTIISGLATAPLLALVPALIMST